MKILFTIFLSFLCNVIFAQDHFEKDFQKLFVGLNVDSKPEEMILGLI